jgi:hypothetical protein
MPELNESITVLGDVTGVSTPPTMAKEKIMASTTLRAIEAAADVNAEDNKQMKRKDGKR